MPSGNISLGKTKINAIAFHMKSFNPVKNHQKEPDQMALLRMSSQHLHTSSFTPVFPKNPGR
jgi:hypothetical protein